MLIIYSLLLTLAFIVMSPLFLLRRHKYTAGFSERLLGSYTGLVEDGRQVIWLHCVSVGETNAARPLVDQLIANFPDHRLVVSTTTKTGQVLARNVFRDKAEAVFYFPFDWKFTVRSALAAYRPSIVLLMETEIWPRFINEAKKNGSKIAIVNGRLSARSFRRYSIFKRFIENVLKNVDIALMQSESDAERIISLGIDDAKVKTTGNLKFDLTVDAKESEVADQFRERFGISGPRPLIIAASTHSPEELWVLEAFASSFSEHCRPRLLIAPRHPERFNEVAEQIARFCRSKVLSMARRSSDSCEADKTADVLLLDTIGGELRAVYKLASVVFVGGSLIRHGGQSVLEPATAARPVITGPYTHNFKAVIEELSESKALVRLPEKPEAEWAEQLAASFTELLDKPGERYGLAMLRQMS